jgi:uncharacterized membrane protein HdeD (DUF308 family)
VALWALAAPKSQGAEWTNIVFGALYFLAPWMLGFAALTGAAWNAWVVGLLVVVLAATALSRAARVTRPA